MRNCLLTGFSPLEVFLAKIFIFVFFLVFVVIMSIYFGVIHFFFLFFGRTIKLRRNWGKFYVEPYGNWPEIGGHKIYPAYWLIYLCVALLFFPWAYIAFWALAPLATATLFSMVGEEPLLEV